MFRALFILISCFFISLLSFSASANKVDPAKLKLASVSAYVTDLHGKQPLYVKNADTQMPIASITKLMTAMVILDGKQSLKQKITFTQDHRALIEFGHTRIRRGSQINRGEALRLALMSSENLAAAALGASYPGGYTAFVNAMNRKAKQLGMNHTVFVEATGLSPMNRSTARDLAKMVKAAYKYKTIRDYSTTVVHTAYFSKPKYKLGYTNTNPLVRGKRWTVMLNKTGYLNEAGRCLVMVAKVSGRTLVTVTLDAYGKRTPIGDAGRIRQWLETGKSNKISQSAQHYQRQKLAKLSDS
ncbi:D-alanyl-D-alanine endopeptidase [Motilimonas pumila]|uniref:D-alanyl-D-alanine endopeptidase n=1 Tax=Motilimonas pumila TaxID=2303987 RepID=A0A418YIY3_9GAMM|nr:D-alanyl-D-alanine endopeptidase [Motilimonas pumila]RJG50606.1 D-alanyl-D-alanine endopeptidase [Motilimonas pumila]